VVYATGKFGGKVRWVSEDMDTRRFKELKVDKLFDEVAVGMTMDEVVRKIGELKMTSVLRPDRYKDFGIKEEDVKRPDGSLKEVRELTYNAPDGALSVYVIDGKVYRKNRIRR